MQGVNCDTNLKHLYTTGKIAAGRRKHKTEKLLSCAQQGHNISPIKCIDSAFFQNTLPSWQPIIETQIQRFHYKK